MCHSVCQKRKKKKTTRKLILSLQCTPEHNVLWKIKDLNLHFNLIYMLLFTFLKTFIFQFREIGDVYGLFCFQQ